MLCPAWFILHSPVLCPSVTQQALKVSRLPVQSSKPFAFTKCKSDIWEVKPSLMFEVSRVQAFMKIYRQPTQEIPASIQNKADNIESVFPFLNHLHTYSSLIENIKLFNKCFLVIFFLGPNHSCSNINRCPYAQKLVIETCPYMKVNMDKPGGLCQSHRREMEGLLLQTGCYCHASQALQ